MADERIQVDDELFLGRLEEQDRFRDALRAVLRDPSKEPNAKPFVFLLYGEGGMGKSLLARRLGDIAEKEAEFNEEFRVLCLDWEKQKELDNALVARHSVSPETVFANIYAIFRDAGFGHEFDPYETTVKDRGTAETKVDQALERTVEKPDERYAGFRQAGAKSLAWLLRTGLPGGSILPEEPTSQVFKDIIEGGAGGLARAREAATTLVRKALTDQDEFDLFMLPNETLAHKLADGIRAAAAKKPLVLILDTYEIADRADAWLRQVIMRTSKRVVWVIAGRDNLADTRKFGTTNVRGYRGDFPSDFLRVFPLSEFSVADVAEYFADRVPAHPLGEKQAEIIHRATLGVPLAVKEATAIWSNPSATLNDITGDDAPSRDRDLIVQRMTERFLMHCWDDPQDRAKLYALALAYRPDAELMAALFQTQDLEHDLNELERRYSFVFVREMKLHNAIETFLREYLLQDLHRKSKEVRAIHERAIEHLRQRRAEREKIATTLEARVEDERWTSATLGLTHHSFWLDEDQGCAMLLPAFVGFVYDDDFARSLLEIAEQFATTMTKANARRLKTLQIGLSAEAKSDQSRELVDELENSAHGWSDDGCLAERRAILDLLRGLILRTNEKHVDALAQFERVEKALSSETNELRKMLARALNALSGDLIWPQGRSNAIYSAEAEGILPKVVEWLPDEQNAWYRLGTILTRGGKPDQAKAAYERAIELDPKDAYPHNGLGNVYDELGKYTEAEAEYRLAIELDPKDAAPHHGLGNLHDELGKHAEADAEYRLAIELEPKLAHPHHGLGNVYYRLDKYAEAEAEYKRAIELEPKYAHPHHGLGNVYYRLDKYAEAEAEYKRAIELEPKDAYSHYGLGNVYYQSDKYEDAIAEYRRAIELEPKDAYSHYGLGNVYYQLDKYAEAEAEYRRAIELDPKFAAPHHGLGNVYRALGKHAEAEAEFRRAVVLDPKFASPHNGLGNVHGQLGKHAEAEAEFREAIELDPKDANPHYGLGNVYRDLGKHDEAVAEYLRAIELDPKDADSHNGLGNVYDELGEHTEAEAEYKRAIDLDPELAAAHTGLGNVCRDLDKRVEAVEAYQRAIELDPKFAAPHNGLGVVYQLLGQDQQAEDEFRQAVALDPQSGTYRASFVGILRKLGRDAECDEQLKIARDLIAKENEYNRACFESICGNVDESLALLTIALGRKQASIEWVRRDPDFENIRNDPRFIALVGKE